MYENKFPEVDSVVMVQVTSIAEMGAYVQLLEYNNIEGNSHSSLPTALMSFQVSYSFPSYLASAFVPSQRSSKSDAVSLFWSSEWTKRKVCSCSASLFVIWVTGYIDLSKRRVSPEDIAACDERFTKSKLVRSVERRGVKVV